MKWRDEVEAGFPAPHGSEPSNLRRDITDEITDHLICAMEKELVKTDDEVGARRTVLERFGDPGRIARRLWFDAMKEIVMKDRILMVSVIVMALAIVGLTVFVWRSFDESRRTNQAMLGALQDLADRVKQSDESKPTSDLSRITFRLVEQEENGKPIVGADFSLTGKAFTEEQITFTEPTSDDGKVSFGLIRPGFYEYSLSRPTLDDNIQLETSGRITLYGGDDAVETIVVPTAFAPVEVVVDMPESLRKEDFLIGIDLDQPRNMDLLKFDFVGTHALIVNTTGEVHTGRWLRDSLPGEVVGGTDEWRRGPFNRPAVDYLVQGVTLYCPRPDSDGAMYEDILDNRWRGPYSYMPGSMNGKVFRIEPDTKNIWRIEVDQEFAKFIRWNLTTRWNKKALKSQDDELAAKVPGRIIDILPIETICGVGIADDKWFCTTVEASISTDPRYAYVLLPIPKSLPDVVKNPGYRSVVALYGSASHMAMAGGSGSYPGMTPPKQDSGYRIGAYRLLSKFPPAGALEAGPTFAETLIDEVPLNKSDFNGEWLLFDVTSAILSQPTNGFTIEGIGFHYTSQPPGKKPAEQPALGRRGPGLDEEEKFSFSSAARYGYNRAPVLLVIDPDKPETEEAVSEAKVH